MFEKDSKYFSLTQQDSEILSNKDVVHLILPNENNEEKEKIIEILEHPKDSATRHRRVYKKIDQPIQINPDSSKNRPNQLPALMQAQKKFSVELKESIEKEMEKDATKLAGGTNGLSTIKEEFQQIQGSTSARVIEVKQDSIDQTFETQGSKEKVYRTQYGGF